jgi:hypothetical protein
MKKMNIVFIRPVILMLALIAFSGFKVSAQGGVAVNTTGNTADPSAMLDVSASDKGVLIPRVALLSSTNPIVGIKPAGLLVWNTSTTGTYSNPGFYFWDGTNWQELSGYDNLGNHLATQNLDMSNNLIINLNDPQSSMDAVNVQTLQSGALIFGTASGTNSYSLLISPAITTYKTGMVINFIASNANTGNVTLDVNGLGQQGVLKNGNLALVPNDIKANQIVSVIYDGTNFQMVSQTGNASTGGGGGTADPTLIYSTDGF